LGDGNPPVGSRGEAPAWIGGRSPRTRRIFVTDTLKFRSFNRHKFSATVCKTVRPMLSDRCLSVLSCLSVLAVLSVTLVYCGQTVRWIKMKLGLQVGLGPGHMLDGDPAPLPQKGRNPQFSAHVYCGVARRLDGSRCHLACR